MSLKAKVEAIIYATEEPVTLDQLASLLGDATLAELQAEEAAKQDVANELSADGAEGQPSIFQSEQLSAGDLTKEQKQAAEKHQFHVIKSRLTAVINELT
jgi:segregation and condensation protein B